MYTRSPEEHGEEFDEWSAETIQDEAQEVFNLSNINLNRNKNITQVARSGGLVVGALATDWEDGQGDYDSPVRVFSMDVAVDPDYRGTDLVGMRLIKAGIAQYEQEKLDWQDSGMNTMMRSWVVNPRLIDIMERRYGFDIESEGGEGNQRWAYVVRY